MYTVYTRSIAYNTIYIYPSVYLYYVYPPLVSSTSLPVPLLRYHTAAAYHSPDSGELPTAHSQMLPKKRDHSNYNYQTQPPQNSAILTNGHNRPKTLPS